MFVRVLVQHLLIVNSTIDHIPGTPFFAQHDASQIDVTTAGITEVAPHYHQLIAVHILVPGTY